MKSSRRSSKDGAPQNYSQLVINDERARTRFQNAIQLQASMLGFDSEIDGAAGWACRGGNRALCEVRGWLAIAHLSRSQSARSRGQVGRTTRVGLGRAALTDALNSPSRRA
jgi:hypothetical protein